jgi:formylmethanofuran dehydrogenase subunit E
VDADQFHFQFHGHACPAMVGVDDDQVALDLENAHLTRPG